MACAQAGTDALPALLSETGLYEPGTLKVARDKLSCAPQYPLWSDGAVKRRWLYLPSGTSIDVSVPDSWELPRGTRLWKEFGYATPIETRLIEHLPDGSWRYATDVWNDDRTDAVLAPESGYRRYPASSAPGGYYPIPSRDDCRACHEGGEVPVLGIGTLQLSPLRDSLAPNFERKSFYDVDILDLVARGLVRNLPGEYLAKPPQIEASSAAARSARGPWIPMPWFWSSAGFSNCLLKGDLEMKAFESMMRPRALNAIVAMLLLASAPVVAADDGNAAAAADDKLQRGKYLVTVAICNDCHTPFRLGPDGPEPDTSRMLSGHPETIKLPPAPANSAGPWNQAVAETNTAWSGPWGISYTANLTPDRDTGLGNWTVRMFVGTIRTGRHQGRGREILPPMPYPMYKHFTDEDLEAIFAYLQSIPPIRNKVPDPVIAVAEQPVVSQATTDQRCGCRNRRLAQLSSFERSCVTSPICS